MTETKNSTREIYVRLLDEGVDVWRPVAALRIDPDVYVIHDSIPDGETWQFQPGDRVRCEWKRFSEGNAAWVAFELANHGETLSNEDIDRNLYDELQ